jgi:hypothetical protein
MKKTAAASMQTVYFMAIDSSSLPLSPQFQLDVISTRPS